MPGHLEPNQLVYMYGKLVLILSYKRSLFYCLLQQVFLICNIFVPYEVEKLILNRIKLF